MAHNAESWVAASNRVGVVDGYPGVSPVGGAGKTAIVVCHGMGQQVRFETIDATARLLKTAAESTTPITARMVELSDPISGQRLIAGRAEVDLDRDGLAEVDVYEAYWAPLTEGAVTLGDVVRFLASAVWNGFWHSSSAGFDRFIFNDMRTFAIPFASFALLAAAGALAFGLLLLTSVLASVLTVGRLATALTDPHWRNLLLDWTADLVLFIAPLAMSILALRLAASRHDTRTRAILDDASPTKAHRMAFQKRVRNVQLPGLDQRVIRGLAYGCLFLTLIGVLATDGLAAFNAYQQLVRGDAAPFWTGAWQWGRNHAPAAIAFLFGRAGKRAAIAVVWLAAAAVTLVVRRFAVQYAGDVAAYVSAPSVDRFFKLRAEIQTTCGAVARAVYASPEYARVVMVGHSLGSVVAYDVLNELINEDLMRGRPLDVIARTGALITFGSPLDKTAFIFRTQRPKDTYVQEALAAAVQPMIVCYEYRPNWVNIWSPEDVVSGRLDFYDAADAAPCATGQHPRGAGRDVRHVVNVRDPNAAVPLVAHVQYWSSPLLARILLDAIREPEGTAARVPVGV